MGTPTQQRPAAPATAADSGQVVLLGLPPDCAAVLVPALASVGVHRTLTADVAHLPDVLAMPDLAALVALQSATPQLRASTGPWTSMSVAVVLVLTSARAQDCAAALHDGATGLVAPGADVRDAVTAVLLALRGQTVLPQAMAAALSTLPGQPASSVTAEERGWLRALAVGGTVAALARASGRSERDLYQSLAALYARLGASDRTTALLAAHRLGLLSDAPQE